MNPILLASQLFGILLLSIIFHEFGHWIYFKRTLKKNVKVKWIWKGIFGSFETGELEDYNVMTDREYFDVNMYGIGIGLIPIILFSIINFFYIYMLLPYSFGAWNDLKEAYKASKTMEVEKDE